MTNIPEKYKKLFKELLKQLEDETENKYSIDISNEANERIFTTGYTWSRVSKIIVYDVDIKSYPNWGFETLEGEYNSFKEIEDKLEFLKKTYSNDTYHMVGVHKEAKVLVIHPMLKRIARMKYVYKD